MLVTLEIEEVADVIDESIARHIALSHDDKEIKNLSNEMILFREEIQKLSYSVHNTTYQLDIDSVKDKIEYLDNKLVKFEESLSSVKPIEDNHDGITEDLKSLRVEMEEIHKSLRETHDKINGIEIPSPVSLNTIQDYVKEQIGQLPVPRDGVDGSTPDMVEIYKYIDECVQIKTDEIVPKEIDLTIVQNYIKDQVSQIPVPKDGESVDIDQLRSFISDLVIEKVSSIPTPKDGEDGQSVDLVEIYKFLDTAINEKISDIEIPTPKDVDIDALRQFVIDLVIEKVSSIPIPKDGESVDLDKLHAFILEKIALIPVEKGDQGDPGESVDLEEIKTFISNTIEENVLKIPTPKDGDSVDLDKLYEFVDKSISDKISAIEIPTPKDGESVDLDKLHVFVDSLVSDKVSSLPVPKDGESVDIGELYKTITDLVEEKVALIPIPQDGVGVVGLSIDNDGQLVATFSTGAVTSLGRVTGRDGTDVDVDNVKQLIETTVQQKVSEIEIPKPVDGINGDDGVGLANALIDIDGNLVVSLTNGETKTVGRVVGKDAQEVDIDSIYPKIDQKIDDKLNMIKESLNSIKILSFDDVSRMINVERDNIIGFIKEQRPAEIQVPVVDDSIPDELAEKIAKAIAIVAESPFIPQHQQIQPIVVNVSQPSPVPAPAPQGQKRIVTRRDEHGNLVGDVVTVHKTISMKKDDKGGIVADIHDE